MSIQSRLWILTLAVILAFGILFVLLLNHSRQAYLDQARRDLVASVREKAQLLSAWRTNLSNTLIALAEQREIREAVAQITSGSAHPAWRDGFISACDASFRAFQISNPAFENLSLRSLDGAKMAGGGAATDDISYPDLRQRIRQVPLSSLKEKWIVPVRNPQAQPLAYVVADINLQQSRKALGAWELPLDVLLCLDDSSGHRIWNSSDSLRIPPLELSANQFDLERAQTYIVTHTPIPGTTWRLSLAQGRNCALSEFNASRKYFILCAAGAIVLVLMLRLILFWRMSKTEQNSLT